MDVSQSRTSNQLSTVYDPLQKENKINKKASSAAANDA